jgi:phage-related protein
MMWRTDYYTESNGRKPVEIWLNSLDKKTSAYIRDKIVRLQQYGLILLDTKMMKPLKGYGSNFYEIIYSRYRIALYHELENNTFVLLHGFMKEHQRETREIEIAYSRLCEYTERGG